MPYVDKEYGKVKMRPYYAQRSRDYKWQNPERHLANVAKRRAKLKGLDYSITWKDIVIPEVCPVLGIELVHGSGRWADTSPTLDRIDNSKGYIQGNIVVISWRANRLKSDASLQELLLLGEWAKKVESDG
jgi:hypothetical protein